LFTAIKLGAPAGLSSIILHPTLFTAVLAAIFLGERIRLHNLLGCWSPAPASWSSPFPAMEAPAPSRFRWRRWSSGGLLLGGGEHRGQEDAKNDGLGLVVWSSLFSPLPLLGLSLASRGR
jgi:O-acetylserine/cysteine efflux transporter